MGFSLILYGFYRIMSFTAFISKQFRESIKAKNVTIVIKTKDGSRARYYKFENGKILSKAEDAPNADMSMIWKDAKTGFKTLSKGKPEAFLEAGMSGDLAIEGDPDASMWFVEIMNEMLEVLHIQK